MLQEAQQHTVSSCLHSYYGSTKDSQHFKSSLVVRPVFSTDLYGFEVLSHYLICMFDYVGKPSTEKEVVFDVQYVDVDHRRESPVAKAMRRNASFGALSDLTEHEYASLHCSSDASISKQLVSRSNSFHEENTQQYLKPSSVVVGKERVDQESIALTLLALKNHNDSLESNKVFP